MGCVDSFIGPRSGGRGGGALCPLARLALTTTITKMVMVYLFCHVFNFADLVNYLSIN